MMVASPVNSATETTGAGGVGLLLLAPVGVVFCCVVIVAAPPEEDGMPVVYEDVVPAGLVCANGPPVGITQVVSVAQAAASQPASVPQGRIGA